MMLAMPSIAARERLLSWYGARRRDLPWRRTRDPYAIWVSEIMLQQTRVAAVVPFYERFLARFPDVRALARARIDSVLARWSGLGYYRRARYHHEAARTIARTGFPTTAAGWRALPGIGAYTSAAIASICFDAPAAVVDGNVERVLSRLHAMRARDRRRWQELADAWLDPAAPGEHNQAVMELGATVCTPRAPVCGACPLRADCAGRGTPERYPAPKPRAKVREERRAVAYVERDGRVLLRRIEGGGVLSGMWDLPETRAKGDPLAVVSHSVLDRRLRIEVHPGRPRAAGRWFRASQLGNVPLAAAARKCLRRVGFLP
jgi:A/G-specific adenine glycosylase